MRKLWKVSIFMLLISFCAYGFLSLDKTAPVVYATETQQDCYYLLNDNSVPYESNTTVGKVSGMGQFVVGKEKITLTATANSNYQLAGWQITYSEQNNRKEFYNALGLTDDSKTVKLTPSGVTDDANKIDAVLTFSIVNGYYTSGTFELARVFEDLVITPVFDHIYYNVEITDLIEISSHSTFDTFGLNTIYYESKTESSVTTYENAYVKIGEKYFYYGQLIQDGTSLYTLHNKLTDDEPVVKEKVDYSKGAFRYNDNVNFELDVNIDSSDIKNSKNIELNSVSVVSDNKNDLNLKTDDISSNYFTKQTDSYLRTTNYSVDFNISASSNYVNYVDVGYHNLYVVDLELFVDGDKDKAIAEQNDILGEIIKTPEAYPTQFKSNITANNIHSIIDESKLQFLVKNQSNNQGLTFNLVCVKNVKELIDGVPFDYYTLNTINGVNKTQESYPTINRNIDIEIKYESVKYNVEFCLMEYVAERNILISLTGDVPEKIERIRGSEVTLNEDSVSDVKVFGYEFAGFVLDLNDELSSSLTYSIDKDKPSSTIVYLCLKKSEFKIIFKNYNTVEIDDMYAIRSINFIKTNIYGQTVQSYISSDLSETSLTLPSDLNLKLGDRFAITQEINNGFKILGYSLKNPATADDYFDDGTFLFTKEFIEQIYYKLYTDISTWEDDWQTLYIYDEGESKYVLNESEIYDPDLDYYTYEETNTFEIYVFEQKVGYVITYFIDPTFDNKLNQNVIMANIGATTSVVGVDIKKYKIANLQANNIQYELIAEDDNSSIVAKIEIAGLSLNDEVIISSIPIVVNEGESEPYSYVFNWFTKDDKTSLPYTLSNNVYTHSINVIGNNEFKVVYSMPTTKVLFTIEEEYDTIGEFYYSVELTDEEGKQIELVVDPTSPDYNSYRVGVGDEILIELTDIAYGYEFTGYKKQGVDGTVDIKTLTFTYTVEAGVNNIVLQFKRVVYRFYFAQFGESVSGEELKGEYVTFGNKNYVEIDIDHTTCSITKPEGVYVSDVKFGAPLYDGYSLDLKESNDIRNDNTREYLFNLTRDQFVDLVKVENLNLAVDSDKDNIFEIIVRLDYRLFAYNIVVNYSLPSEPKGEINYQLLEILYTLDEEISIKSVEYSKEVTFTEIPYGATNVQINLLGEAPKGVKFATDGNYWKYSNGYYINPQTLPNDSSYLKIGTITEDKSFMYVYEYINYTIAYVDYPIGQEAPITKVNGIEGSALNIYDSFEISASENKETGYKFIAIKCLEMYVYNEETWDEDKKDLYIKFGTTFKKTNLDSYNGEEYYVFKELTTDLYSPYTDSKFDVSNYFIINDSLYFKIEYEILSFNLTNKNELDVVSLTGCNLNEKFITLDNNSIALFETEVIYPLTRELGENSKVLWGERINVIITLNTSAKFKVDESQDYEEYNLSNGLDLLNVQIEENEGVFSAHKVALGQYLFELTVEGDLYNLETLNIVYTWGVISKELYVTTQIQDPSFYNGNFRYAITYAGSGQYGTNSIWHYDRNSSQNPIYFINTYTVSVDFMNNYADYFKVSGLKIYSYNDNPNECVIINSNDYDDYGIVENEDSVVKIQFLKQNYKVVFTIEPIISFKYDNPNFKKVFECDENGVAKPQGLKVGSRESGADIIISSFFIDNENKNYITINYIDSNGLVSSEVKNCGKYLCEIEFIKSDENSWLEQLLYTPTITLTITPRVLSVELISSSPKWEKTYDKSSSYNFGTDDIRNHLVLKDKNNYSGSSVKVKNIELKEILKSASNNFLITNVSNVITTNENETGAISQAHDQKLYNLYCYGLKFAETSFNNNFVLDVQAILIENCVKINKVNLEIQTNLSDYIYSKVYDGTDEIKLGKIDNILLDNIILDDEVYIDAESLKIKFENASVGTNKKVTINYQEALKGKDSANYLIENSEVYGLTIYPDRISTVVDGFGEIELINQRKKTHDERNGNIELIPIDAKLVVEAVYSDTVEYANIYRKISKYLRGNNEFVVSYNLKIMVGEESYPVSNYLHLSVPYVKDVTGVYFLNGNETGEIKYDKEGFYFIIDLNQFEGNTVENIFITKKRILLTVWQIVLIVIAVVLVITAVVLTFVIIRKRRRKEYDVFEKI